jgi:hypothetical protein
MRLLVVSAACAVTLAACGSSSAKSAPPVSTTTSTAAAVVTTTTAAPAAPITRTACSFATPAQVQAVLGAPAKSAGVETDYEPAYKTCNWIASGPAGGNDNEMRVGVMRRQAGQQPFPSRKTGLDSTAVSGVGATATFSTSARDTGVGEVLLVADKGAVSVSIDVNYAGSITTPTAPQDPMIAIAKAVIAQVVP